jgi:hypothetical protein
MILMDNKNSFSATGKIEYPSDKKESVLYAPGK